MKPTLQDGHYFDPGRLFPRRWRRALMRVPWHVRLWRWWHEW